MTSRPTLAFHSPAFLADPTAARSMIGYWHDTACLSVCPSVRQSVAVYCG